MSDVKVGDVVRLKSGGLAMVVTSVEDYLGTMSVYCEWQDPKTGDPKTGVFALTSVEKVDRGPSSDELRARGPKVV